MHSANFALAPATLTDADAIAPLFDAYRQFYEQPADLARSRRFIAERLRLGESHIILARSRTPDCAAVGFTQLYPLFSSTVLRRVWVLNDLFVIPAWRRNGVGRALLLAARDFAVSTQAAEMFLETARGNTIAQAAYEALGWQRESVFYKYNLPLD
ncbi:MAG: GNAT family N-acetyltransferase [Candidatus Eremiobacteraeota bacterium]|nr:GNAT family N-acetyltransferase [Candidatus Eremiobacteraeota bacterium]